MTSAGYLIMFLQHGRASGIGSIRCHYHYLSLSGALAHIELSKNSASHAIELTAGYQAVSLLSNSASVEAQLNVMLP